jgi:hypothetical protein
MMEMLAPKQISVMDRELVLDTILLTAPQPINVPQLERVILHQDYAFQIISILQSLVMMEMHVPEEIIVMDLECALILLPQVALLKVATQLFATLLMEIVITLNSQVMLN